MRSGLGWSFVNNVAGRSLTFASGLVLARILAPQDFGVFAIAMVAYALLISLNDIGIQTTVVRWPGDVDEIGPTATTLIFVASLGFYALFYVAAPGVCDFLHTPGAVPVIRLLAVAIIIDGAFAVPTGLLTRSFRQDRRAIADVANAVVSTAITVVLALNHFGVWSLVWGRLVGNLVNSLLCAGFASRRYVPGFDRRVARELVRSGAPLVGTTVVTVAIFNVDYLTIGRVLGAYTLGFYVLAFNISSWAIGIFSFAVTRVSIPAFARLQHDPPAVRAAFVRAMSLLALATVPVCALMSGLAAPLITFVYGARWLPGTAALEFLAVFAIIRILQDLSMDTLIAIGNSAIALGLQLGWLVALVPSLIVAAHFGGIGGVAMAQLIIGVLVVVPSNAIVFNRIGVRLRSLARHLAWPVLGGTAAGVVAAFVANHVASPFTRLAAGAASGLVVYAVAVVPLRKILSDQGPVLEPRLAESSVAVEELAADVPAGSEQPPGSAAEVWSVWFGPPDRPLFGWLHLPPGRQARGGVVLCPPLGIEGRRSHLTFRILAERLAADGFVALRFDYDGTGDSSGRDTDPGRVAAWIGSVSSAIEYVRSCGVCAIAVVGMRLGATLAATALDHAGLVDALVMWDPCATGRAFVREQRALREFIAPTIAHTDGSVELPGFVFSAETAAALDELGVARLQGGLADRILVLARADRPVSHELRRRLDGEQTPQAISWGEATGQAELLEALFPHDQPPLDAISSIIEWLKMSLDSTPEAVCPPPSESHAVVARDRAGRAISETVMRFGQLGLVGVLTEPPERTGEPLVMFLNDGHEHRIGPGRIWVDLARQWAGLGFEVVRLDLSGIGDSPSRPGSPIRLTLAPEVFDDLEDVATHLRPDDPSQIVLIGISAGGYHAIDCGIHLRARGVGAVNAMLRPAPLAISFPEAAHGPRDPRRRASPVTPRWLSRLGRIHPRLPNAIWLGISQLFPSRSPSIGFERIVEAGADTLVVSGEAEARQVVRLAHWKRTQRRLEATGRFHFEVVPGLEHTLLNSTQREIAKDLLTEHVLRFRDDTGTSPTRSDATSAGRS